MENLIFEKIDRMIHGKLSLTIQYARETAEAQGFGEGYCWGKERISRIVGWESCYRGDGSPERARVRDLLKSSAAYDAAIKRLEAECIKGDERRLENLELGTGFSPITEEFLRRETDRNEWEKRGIYAEILASDSCFCQEKRCDHGL